MNFLNVISGWINRHFSNEQAIFLVALVVVFLMTLITIGGFLAPVLTGLVIAFLMQGMVFKLIGLRVPRPLAIGLSMLFVFGGLLAVVLGLLPLAWQQMNQSIASLPKVVEQVGQLFIELSDEYPDYLSDGQIQQWLTTLNAQLTDLGAAVVQGLVNQVSNFFGLLIFVVLVPISSFFFIKDKDKLLDWFQSLLPRERDLLHQVGNEMTRQMSNYIRGKVIEIIIIGSVTYVVFALLGLSYSALLGLLVGLSVLVPFVGAAIVTLPVAAVGLLQFGWTWEFAWIMAAYGVIQAIDGNILVPVLFSEALDLHPIAIIVSILVFGGVWGFWGVFFAIPMATFIKAIFNAWPNSNVTDSEAAKGSDNSVSNG